MFKNSKLSLLVKIGYSYGVLFGGLLLVLVVISIFSDSFNFSLKLLYLITPVIAYVIYLKVIVERYYTKLVNKEISSWQEISLRIDKVETVEVQKKVFNYYGLGANIDEYYITFFNKELSKYITISSIGHQPVYDIISSWKNRMITVFMNTENIHKKYNYNEKKKISTIKVFRFIKDQHSLEATYLQSVHEFIAKKRQLEGFLIIFTPLFMSLFCIYLIIQLLKS
ncbi:hypothetical protein [uncultured Aquimarina sp.]|uniref:hypothetical protein n=1 Tax=uncultured Aquimarina sp. TaxID=575652 RepID=UPI00261663F5|nr:hypothetical protein [uncultured Aquimarina sp.]